MGNIDLARILNFSTKPAPFEKTGQPIWTDDHVARQLLAVHIDPNTDAASRRPETIDKTVAWIVNELQLTPGMEVLDLGCGPGLYCQRLAKAGMKMVGVDFSETSLSYARKIASAENLSIDYRLQNYLQFAEQDRFDAAFMIYGDYCVLSPAERKQLLQAVRRALVKGGRFVLDVTTRECRRKYGLKNGWYGAESGFWSAKRHIVLEQGFDYPEDLIYLDQYIVMDEDGCVRIFRNWFQDFTVDSIQKELNAGQFQTRGVYADLLGNSFTEESEWIGIVAEKK